MPKLPSGLNLALYRDAIIKHDDNWFKCPDGHFWYWTPAPEMGPPPYDLRAIIDQVPQHTKVPTTREEVKQFIRVLEMCENGNYGWRGEWLTNFPRFQILSEGDTAAWECWIERPETQAFLDETIDQCSKMAEVARNAVGYLVTRPDADRQFGSDGSTPILTWTPRKQD